MKQQYITVPVVEISLDDVIGTFDETSYEMDCANDHIEYLVPLLSTSEVEVLTLKFLGFTSKEIAGIMNFKNIQSYYQLRYKLRKSATALINNR